MKLFLKRSPLVLSLLVCAAGAAHAQVGVGVTLPGVNIGINMPAYPHMVRVPNYPVYYAPGVSGNFFFYDGLYWVYHQDSWYSSAWYNGPWQPVSPHAVPVYVLRVPVRYYRNPPAYFHGWRANEPPRWGEHWGHDWSRQRSGWDHWDRRAAPPAAPLPDYQRHYSGNRYPHAEQQHSLHSRHYGYQPRDADLRQHPQHQWPQQQPSQQHPSYQQQRPAQQAYQQQPHPQQPSTQPHQRHQPLPYQPLPYQQQPHPQQHQRYQQQPMPYPQQPNQQQPYQQQKWPQ